MAVLSMSDGELRRLEVLRDVDRGGLPVRAAAQLLGRSDRQVWRLLKGFRAAGAAGLVSKKRGRPSNRRTAAAVRAAGLWILRQNYADFGPTHSHPRQAALSLACGRPGRKCPRHPDPDPAQPDRSQAVLSQAAEGLAIRSAGDRDSQAEELRRRPAG